MDFAFENLKKPQLLESKKAKILADGWDARFPVGTTVKYQSLLDEKSEYDMETKTRSAAFCLGGQAVVQVEGKSGCVSITHLIPAVGECEGDGQDCGNPVWQDDVQNGLAGYTCAACTLSYVQGNL